MPRRKITPQISSNSLGELNDISNYNEALKKTNQVNISYIQHNASGTTVNANIKTSVLGKISVSEIKVRK